MGRPYLGSSLTARADWVRGGDQAANVQALDLSASQPVTLRLGSVGNHLEILLDVYPSRT
jgi:hypothetical protein